MWWKKIWDVHLVKNNMGVVCSEDALVFLWKNDYDSFISRLPRRDLVFTLQFLKFNRCVYCYGKTCCVIFPLIQYALASNLIAWTIGNKVSSTNLRGFLGSKKETRKAYFPRWCPHYNLHTHCCLAPYQQAALQRFCLPLEGRENAFRLCTWCCPSHSLFLKSQSDNILSLVSN